MYHNIMNNKKKIITFVFIVFIILAISFFLYKPQQKMTVFLGEKAFLVDVAQTERDLIKGLSDRNSLALDEGMLFVFNNPQKYGFWMRDMNFPLDIVWISDDYQIVHIEKSLATSTYPTIFYPKSPARYILEISSGQVDQLKINIGDFVRFVKR